MIAKGVRFNAEKKQVGNYYSTKVSFFHDAVNEMENFHLYAKICQLKWVFVFCLLIVIPYLW